LLLTESYAVTILVRKQAHATELQAIGAATIIGSLEDEGLLEQHVLRSNVIINSASSDHLPSVTAILHGVKRRVESGKDCIYIHTSGADVLGDDYKGAYKSNKTFWNNKADDIDALPDNAVHWEVDLAILEMRRSLGRGVRIAIMVPPMIYGVGSRGQRLSIQLPTLIRFALKHGFAGHVGAGLSTWSQVHITDLARGYIALLQWLEQPNSDSIYTNLYFFAENGEQLLWCDCAAMIREALYAVGRIEDPKPREVQEQLFDDLFGEYTWQAIG
jgi:nucleoside-diphosphate-sugar epimerase